MRDSQLLLAEADRLVAHALGLQDRGLTAEADAVLDHAERLVEKAERWQRRGL